LCSRNLETILEYSESEIPIEIDMEDSDRTDATLRIFMKERGAHESLGIALQAYLYRTMEDLEGLKKYADQYRKRIRIRLVKGAYNEPKRISYSKGIDVDKNYMKLTKYLLENESFAPAIATHNEQLIEYSIRMKEAVRREVEGFEFQMLLGVRSALQLDLARRGFAVRVYIPYGDSWYPYLMRRIGERPANGLFLLRQII
jgi:proline dehydrogenase